MGMPNARPYPQRPQHGWGHPTHDPTHNGRNRLRPYRGIYGAIFVYCNFIIRYNEEIFILYIVYLSAGGYM